MYRYHISTVRSRSRSTWGGIENDLCKEPVGSSYRTCSFEHSREQAQKRKPGTPTADPMESTSTVVDLERDTCIYIVLVRSLIPISVSSPAVEQNEMGL